MINRKELRLTNSVNEGKIKNNLDNNVKIEHDPASKG